MDSQLEGPRHLAALPLKLAAVVVAAVVVGTGTIRMTRITVGQAPCAEVAGLGSVWVANYGSSTISRVDPHTNRVTGTVRVGSEPCGLALGGGALWVDGYGTESVERVDPRSLRRTKVIHSGLSVWDVAFDGRHVWADNNGDGTVVEIDPATNRVVRRIHVGGSPTGLAVLDGSLWVGSNGYGDRSFFRVEVRTGAVTTIHPGCLRPAYFAVRAGRQPWVTCVGDMIGRGYALRLDPRTNRVVARVRVGRTPGDGAIDAAGRVWIPDKADGTVSRIDPATNAVVQTLRVGGTPFVLNDGFGDIWVPDGSGDTVARLHVT
jgi:YVTN family beta-propeller protein